LPRRRRFRVAGVRGTGGLDQQEAVLALGVGLVLDAAWHHVQLSGAEHDRTIAEPHVQLAVEDEKEVAIAPSPSIRSFYTRYATDRGG
jgi:hypothetical protein